MDGDETTQFPVVGLGASAGGLEALQTFFDHVPEDSGIGFVVITHTLPDRKSLLPDLLAAHSSMPVIVVDEPKVVEPNHVYLAQAGERLHIQNGRLERIDELRQQRLPIDLFFRSLAQDKKDQAIGVVLSGTGSDGTLGLEEIKGAGGMVMAQDQASARFPGMPLSAIQTELVDYVLPAEELPEQLLAYVQLAFGDDGFQRPDTPISAESLDRIFLLLRSRTGHDFSGYKRTTIFRRVERRMHVHQLRSMQEYLQYLSEHPAEIDLLFKELLIGVTSFFRDPDAFELLADQILPEILGNKPDDYLLRVWVPGCSTGEEAYSIAMVFREAMDKLKRHFSVQIFATDLDPNAIEFARTGLYPASIAADVGAQRLERFFTKEDDCYRIRKEVREKLIFAPQNLLEDPPFTKVDLLSCRNLLIYLEGKLQQRLMPTFHYALRPGGILFLGSSEALGSYGHLFEIIDKRWKLFRRKDGPAAPYLTEFPSALMQELGSRTPSPRTPAKAEEGIGRMIERLLLDQLVPPSALVHENGDVVHIHGRTGRFLEPAPGPQLRVNIFNMLRDNLQLDLASAIRRATDVKEVVHEGVRVKANSHWIVCDLRVRHLADPPGLRGLYLVSFEHGRAEDSEPKVETHDSTGARHAELEHELQRMREYHQGAIEELETANEELKSTNEELQSTNEELQSTNEELETSKEEMQSLNEELQTVNAELEGKVDELSRTTDDMKNLLNGTEIATIFLDSSLRIKRYTERAKRMISLIPSDIGRPIADLVTRLDYDRLIADSQEVLHTLVFKEVEIRSHDGDWFLMRILPYRTTDNVIDGLVITFVDVTKTKGLQSSQERILRALGKSPTTVFGQNGELRYEWVSGEVFGHRSELAVGRSDFELLPESEAKKLEAIKKRVLDSREAVRQRVELALPAGKHVWELHLEPIPGRDGTSRGLIGSMTRC